MLTPGKFAGVRVIGFDLDQTLYPKSPEVDAKIQQYLLEQIALQLSVSLKEANKLFSERYQSGRGMTGSEALADLGLANSSGLVQEALERADLIAALSPDPEVRRLLADLKACYESVDLITGSGQVEARKKLAAIGLAPEAFGRLITADEASKSTGESYRLWLAHYPTLAPEQFLYIGDRPRSDHEVPAALGIQTALVYTAEPDPALSALQLPALADIREHLL